MTEILKKAVPDVKWQTFNAVSPLIEALEKESFSANIFFYDFDLPSAESRSFLQRYDLLHASAAKVYILSSYLSWQDKEALSSLKCVTGFIQKPLDRAKVKKLLNLM